MGNFSWDCEGCGTSLRGPWACEKARDRWRGEAVLVAETGAELRGTYDGYGRVGGTKLPAAWDNPEGAFLVGMAASDDERAGRLDALAAKMASVGENAAATEMRKLAAGHRASATECRATAARSACVRFTAWHARCYRRAGRPGFVRQSPQAKDQGG